MGATFPGGESAITTILVVRDVEASVAWYRDALGAEVNRTYGTSAVLRLFDAWLCWSPPASQPTTSRTPT